MKKTKTLAIPKKKAPKRKAAEVKEMRDRIMAAIYGDGRKSSGLKSPFSVQAVEDIVNPEEGAVGSLPAGRCLHCHKLFHRAFAALVKDGRIGAKPLKG